MKNSLFSLSALMLVSALSPVLAAPKAGPKLEVVFPFASETRDRFGSVLTGIGVGFGNVVPRAGGHFAPDVVVAREEKNDNKLAFYGAGLQYRRTFSPVIQPNTQFVPFYGASLGAAYGKVELAGSPSDSKIVPTGSIFLGTSLGKSGLLEVRARGIGKVAGLDFSGLSLTLGARF